jgi:putative tricarboxylic transport membrane protein
MLEPDAARAEKGDARRSASAIIVALAAAALGGFVIQQALSGTQGPSYATVGPGVFPLIIGAALVLVGLGLLTQALGGAWRVTWIEAGSTDAKAAAPSPLAKVLLIGVALVLDVVLMQPTGFVLASTALFICVTRAFGSRRLALDAALGLLFTGTIYVVFTRGLGLSLPAGRVWENLPWTF